MNKCLLCEEQFQYDTCDYCGLVFVETDGSAPKYHEDIDAHRQKTLNMIEEIGFIGVRPLFDKTKNTEEVYFPLIREESRYTFECIWLNELVIGNGNIMLYKRMQDSTTCSRLEVDLKHEVEFDTFELGIMLNKNLKLDVYYRKPGKKSHLVAGNIKLGTDNVLL